MNTVKRKMDFIIDSKYEEIEQIYSLFLKVVRFEEEYEKDLSEFSEEEAKKMYCSLHLMKGSLYRLNKLFKEYTVWCNSSQNAYSNIRNKDFDKLTGEKAKEDILSKQEIYGLATSLKNPCDSFILLGMFEGLFGEQLEELNLAKIEHVDLKNGEIVAYRYVDGAIIPHRTISLTKELLAFIEMANKTFEYCDEKGRVVQKFDAGGIIKYKDKPELHDINIFVKKRKEVIRTKIKRLSAKSGKKLTPVNVRNSGLVFFARKEALEAGMEFKDFLRSEKMNSISKKFGYEQTKSAVDLIKRYL